MNPLLLSLLTLMTFLVTAGGTGWMRKWLIKRNILDYPGARTSHTVPMPRGGGTRYLHGADCCLDNDYKYISQPTA